MEGSVKLRACPQLKRVFAINDWGSSSNGTILRRCFPYRLVELAQILLEDGAQGRKSLRCWGRGSVEDLGLVCDMPPDQHTARTTSTRSRPDTTAG